MSSEDSVSSSSGNQRNYTDATPDEARPEGVLAGIKSQIDSATGGSSISEIGNKVIAVAGEKANGLNETVLGGAVPAVGQALQSAQDQIRSLAGGGSGTGEDNSNNGKHAAG